MEGSVGEHKRRWEVTLGPIATAILVLSVILISASALGAEEVNNDFRELVSDYQEERRRKKLYKETSWVDTHCLTQVVHTERDNIKGHWEDEAEWCERHESAVASTLLAHPVKQ